MPKLIKKQTKAKEQKSFLSLAELEQKMQTGVQNAVILISLTNTDNNFIKFIGNRSLMRFIKRMCSCGCRMVSDNTYVWCSGIKCTFFEKIK